MRIPLKCAFHMRGYAAIGLGLLGFVVGFVTGAEIAPETHSETVIWSRN